MKLGKHFDKDAVGILAVLAAVIWGTWLYARQSLQLEAEWTDGSQRYEAAAGEGIRHAVWDNARALDGDVNSDGNEARPAISPDGRFLVFASGEIGLNVDLWIAEIAGDDLINARALGPVNSSADDLAPAFSKDALVFATNRGGAQFGLDIWRAPYSDGVFGEPMPLGFGVNTNEDETDPCPDPNGTGLLFASNRAHGSRGDFDLYWVDIESGGDPEVVSLVALNTPFDERDPAYSIDGSSLYFASNRSGGQGGFDLWRSFNEGYGWLPAQPLVGINGPGDERGPLPSSDGFSLLFDGDDARGERQSDLWRARSTELFRIPAPDIGPSELVILALLILLAVLAMMAKRWRGIAVLYRCFLISVCLHLFALWFLRDVAPQTPPVIVASSEQLFHVRLATSAASSSGAMEARDGELQAERSSLSAATAAQPKRQELQTVSESPALEVASQLTAMEAPERSAESAPARSESGTPQTMESSGQVTDVQMASERLDKHDGSRPGLLVSAQSLASQPAASTKGASPSRQAVPASAVSHAEPSRPSIDAEQAQGDRAVDGQTSHARTELSAGPSRAHAAILAPHAESFDLAGGSSPGLVMTASAQFEVGDRARGNPSPTRNRAASSSSFEGANSPSSGAALQATKLTERTVSPSEGPSRLRKPVAEVAVDVSSADLREAQTVGKASGSAPGMELESASTFSASKRASSGPRSRMDISRKSEPAGAVLAGALSLGVTPAEVIKAQLSTRISDPGSAIDFSATAVNTNETGSAVTKAKAAPARFDATQGMANRTARSSRTSASIGPRRMDKSRDAVDRAGPKTLDMAVAAAPKEQVDSTPPTLTQTPYKNRFGDEKLRALDEFGGSEETEAAVLNGLKYLASVQNQNGSFGSRADHHSKYGDVRIGKTALSLLAFLGAGNSPGSNRTFALNSERAVKFLLQSQSRSNGHFGQGSSYGHGIATYALAECFALTHDTKLVEPLERAIERILNEQKHSNDKRQNGGWGYYFADDHTWSGDHWARTSISSWQLMALESARLGGINVPGKAFEDAGVFFANAWDSRRGAFRYSHDPERMRSGYAILPASTPASMFALSILGLDLSSPNMAGGRAFILERSPTPYRRASVNRFVHEARGNLYFWYYATLAMFRTGGDDWKRWNVAMKDTLLPAQSADGSWPLISTYAEYAGDDHSDLSYTTAMNVLTLEVYYRYFTPLLKVR